MGACVDAIEAHGEGVWGIALNLAVPNCGENDPGEMRWNEDALPLQDVERVERPGGCWEPVLTVRGGAVVSSKEESTH